MTSSEETETVAATRNHRFHTERLIVDEWHTFTQEQWPLQNPANAVQEILTERTTQTLPPSWQGSYTLDRASRWIIERDNEGVTLLVIDKADRQAIGMVILFEPEGIGKLRLGYVLVESAWGKGIASELVGGFVDWCRHHEIHSITGGVDRDNIASRRVLEKCGFMPEPETGESDEQLFTLQLK